jgi:putative peptidoglycan lipid II flippase
MDAVDDSAALAAEPIPVPEAPGETGIGDETTTTFGVAGWTLLSRITGLLRVAVAGAVLGSTFFANIFQATNTIPNLTYNLLAGSMLTALIIPLVVAALDEQGLERARELLRHLVGLVIAGFVIAAVVVIAFSPVLVRLLTLGVDGAAATAAARRECWILLFLVVPQIFFYGLIAVAIAAQNARGKFRLAAAAPSVENIGTIVTLLLVGQIFGTGTTNVSTGCVVFLGTGATLSVATHAALQCFGAARVGLPLRPGWGWHDSTVRALTRRLVPAIATATLDAAWLFILIVAAGVVPGGVVALQIGVNFYHLPIALSAKAVGTVLMPRMAREVLQNRLDAFRETYDRGISWSWFVAVPTALTLLLLSKPIADSIAFGEMRSNNGVALLSAAIATFGIALIGATVHSFAKQACYARHDVVAPLIGCTAMTAVALIGSPLSASLPKGPAVLVGLGLTVMAAELTSSLITDRAARRGTRRRGVGRVRTLGRHAGIAVATIGPGALLGRALASVIDTQLGAILGVAVGAGGGLLAYVAVQAALGAPELPPGLHFGRRRAASSEVGAAPS